VNGAMEFDAETLRPTYRFRSGIPGSSYALEMAARLGLDTAVLERSRSFLGHQQTRLESLIVDLEASTQRHRKEIELLTGERGGLARAKEEYEMKLAALNAELRQTRARALAEAREIIDRSNSVIEQTVREIRESRGEKEIIRAAERRCSP